MDVDKSELLILYWISIRACFWFSMCLIDMWSDKPVLWYQLLDQFALEGLLASEHLCLAGSIRFAQRNKQVKLHYQQELLLPLDVWKLKTSLMRI